MNNKNGIIKFNIFDISFTPHVENESKLNSKSILEQCIKKINDTIVNKNTAIVIDKHEGRTDQEPRKLFVRSAAFIAKKRKYKCKISLIRDNKIPTFVDKENFTVTSMKNFIGNKAIAETTNFYISIEGSKPTICCEFNNYGPRISDIEYYFRTISSYKMLAISKACKVSVHLHKSIDNVLENLSDVLSFKFKLKYDKMVFLNQQLGNDAFIGNMSALANTIEPNYLKVNAFFRDRSSGKEIKNKSKGNSFIKRMLNSARSDASVLESIDDLQLEFEDNNGEIDTFSLISDKVEFNIECSYSSPGIFNSRELFEKIDVAFSEYLENRKK